MSRQLKLVLAILAALVLAGVLAVGGFVWWLKSNLPALQERVLAQASEGQRFAEGRSAAECLPETLRRVAACDGMSCEIGSKQFLAACLTTASPIADLCDGVPPPDDLGGSLKYRLAVCLGEPAAVQQPCTRVVPAVQEHCHPGRR